MIHTIHIPHRSYASWTIDPPLEGIHPLQSKLMDNDRFTYINNRVQVISSNNNAIIPCVLLLQENKSFGKEGTRPLYKCVPDNIRLPILLVPYEIKQIGFSKIFPNMYVTVRSLEWREGDNHPRGILDSVIGAVNEPNHYYEYQLYCKQLHHSIQTFQKQAQQNLNSFRLDCSFQDRTQLKCITIDPKGATDFDDALSIQSIDCKMIISIYITNVAWMMDTLQLWEHFSNRISTVYLPNKRRSMLPPSLEQMCSFREKETRVAMVADVTVRDHCIESVQLGNAIIRVTRNYEYEEPALLKDPTYRSLLFEASQLNKSEITDSYGLVSFFMVWMNEHVAHLLHERGVGIFRTVSINNDIVKYAAGKYMLHNDDGQSLYTHITSPIRRIVDVLNQIQFLETKSEAAVAFYNQWILRIDDINAIMRTIRKLQYDCDLLHACTHNARLLEQTHEGIVHDKTERKDGMFHYFVYLPQCKLFSRIVWREDIPEGSSHQFQIYMFHDEDRFTRKLRLQMVS